jgi:hypothetical protein
MNRGKKAAINNNSIEEFRSRRGVFHTQISFASQVDAAMLMSVRRARMQDTAPRQPAGCILMDAVHSPGSLLAGVVEGYPGLVANSRIDEGELKDASSLEACLTSENVEEVVSVITAAMRLGKRPSPSVGSRD